MPGLPSLFLLAYLFVLLPVAAVRSAKRLQAVGDDASPLPAATRSAIWTSTMITQAALLLIAWLVGPTFEFEIFAMPGLRPADVAAAVLTLGILLSFREALRQMRDEDEKQSMFVFRVAPRSTKEWVLWSFTGLVASIAEEAAYRGVAFAILWYSLGNPWIAAVLCALAFAAAHAVQGFKSGVFIFAMALVMHGLVAYTGTLVLAMLVHLTYDALAAVAIAREAKQIHRSEG